MPAKTAWSRKEKDIKYGWDWEEEGPFTSVIVTYFKFFLCLSALAYCIVILLSLLIGYVCESEIGIAIDVSVIMKAGELEISMKRIGEPVTASRHCPDAVAVHWARIRGKLNCPSKLARQLHPSACSYSSLTLDSVQPCFTDITHVLCALLLIYSMSITLCSDLYPD